MARLGNGDFDSAWEALEKASVSRNEVGYQVSYPLLDTLARCALARRDLRQSRELAGELLQRATEYRQPDYAARGHRLLAELATLDGDYATAAAQIRHSLEALEGRECWNVEWQVHATAAHVFAKLGRRQECEQARELSRRAADRVAASLFDEPELRQIFLTRVNRDLAEA